MKLGIVSAILDGWTYEEMIDDISAIGYECIEVACWPQGKAERRYAGVSHIDAVRVLEDDGYARHVLEKRTAAISHLKTLIRASSKLGVDMVTTFIGRDQGKSVEENLDLVREIWPPILDLAKELGVKVAIENCPMLFGRDQWPGGQNLMTTPSIWRKVFEILPYDNLGINYDPSHFIWQMIDYTKPLYEFRDKIFHVHYKDIKVYRDKLDDVGIMGYPLDFMSPKLPGLGDVDWGRYVSALTDIRYDGYTCVEIEDKAFESSKEKVVDSIVLAYRYMRQFVI